MTRITHRSVVLTSLDGLHGNLAAVNKLQQQLSSGKQISQPSDDPTGTNTALLTRQSIAGNDQQARNISEGRTTLDATDSALQNMLDQARRVRVLTVQALNSGAQDANSRGAIATEVTGIRASLLGQANQVMQGRPLFGGNTSGNRAYDDATGAYTGVGGANGIPVLPVSQRVSDVETIRVDITGPEAFGDPAGGNDLFGVVKGIATDIGDPVKLATHLAELDAVMSRMTSAAADVGTRSAQMDVAATQNSSQALSLQAKLGETENIDMARTIMNLQVQQNAYQAALSATAKSISPSLVEFLR